MSVRSKEELLNILRTNLGDDTSDQAISLIEDISDTLDDLTNRNSEDWKNKYETNDAEWRRKYTERFFSRSVKDQDEEEEEEEKIEKVMTYKDLFKEGV